MKKEIKDSIIPLKLLLLIKGLNSLCNIIVHLIQNRLIREGISQYSGAVVTLSGLSLSYSYTQVYNIRFKETASKMVTLAEIVTLLFTWLIGQVFVTILFKEYWKYLYYLIKCDDAIGAIQPSKKITFVILIVFLFTFTCLGTDIYMWTRIALPVMGILNFIWKIVPFYFTYVFTMIVELNFWIAIYGITIRLKRLNKLICSYINMAESERGRDDIMVENLDTMKRKKKAGHINNKTSTCLSWLTSEAVQGLILAYKNISNATVALNKFFEIIITTVLFTVIVCLIITPYVLYQQILNSKSNTFIFTQSFWMTCHILRLLLIIEPCHRAQIEGAEIKKSLVNLLNFDLSDDVRKQVKKFWLTVMENNIEFSAFGMAIINRNLLPSIGGTVFTYLAIIFQYNSGMHT